MRKMSLLLPDDIVDLLGERAEEMSGRRKKPVDDVAARALSLGLGVEPLAQMGEIVECMAASLERVEILVRTMLILMGPDRDDLAHAVEQATAQWLQLREKGGGGS